MKRLVACVFLILLSAGAGVAQSVRSPQQFETMFKSFRNSNRYDLRYDKFKNVSTVYYAGSRLPSRLDGYVYEIWFGFPGEKLSESVTEFYLRFNRTGDKWQFLYDRNFIALVDGERVNFGEGVRNGEIVRRGVTETLTFKLTVDEMRSFGSAESLEFQISGSEFKVDKEQFDIFQNFLSLATIDDLTHVTSH